MGNASVGRKISAGLETIKVPANAAYATGRRKEATARAWLFKGTGKITINGRNAVEYFANPSFRMMANQPFVSTRTVDHYDVYCTVKGSGLSAQSQAVRHAISRALVELTDTLKPVLKKDGLLTRDPRQVERKKPGRKKARKRFQFSKR